MLFFLCWLSDAGTVLVYNITQLPGVVYNVVEKKHRLVVAVEFLVSLSKKV